MPQTYRCHECGWPIFTGENLSGSLKLKCPNQQCRSNKVQPVRRQSYDFDKKK